MTSFITRLIVDADYVAPEAKEEITPDATKSTQDKVKETVTDTGDRLGRGVQPDDNKGAAQQAFDKTQRASDNEVHGGASNSM